MKITAFLLTAAVWSVAASTYAQSFKISLRKQQVPLIDVLKEVETNSEFTFFFNDNQIDVQKKVDIRVENATLDQVMARLFDPEEYTYRVIARQVIIRRKSDAEQPQNTEQQQSRKTEITGLVLDETGEPVIGANVVEKGTANGVVTGADGKFAIRVPAGAELTVSYIGYLTARLKVGNQKQLTVRLKENTQAIEEVVVVGYGTQKKESLTGAISHIRNKEILTTTHSSLAQSLAGKISGLRIRQNSGEPGDFNSMINIRGFGDPLYIIDGVPQDLGGTDFQRLNPQDIESISVIKDASAAIYGLRAGNGVVIVTTNRGGKGKTRFNYDVVFGWQRPTDMPRMANRSEWAQMRNEANLNAGSTPFFTREELAAETAGASTDWYGLTMRNFSTQQQHNLSASGGTDKVSYFASLGYVRDDGLLRSGDLHYDKYTFRSNVSMQLTNYFKGEVNVSGRYDTKMSPSQGFHNIFYGTRTALPDSPAYANDNPEYPAYQRFLNPVAISQSDLSGYAQNKNRQLSSTVSLTYEVPFVKGLSLKGLGSYIYNNIQDKMLSKEYKLYTYDEQAENPYHAVKKNSPSKITQTDNNIDMLALQAHLSYSARIARDHRLGMQVLVGVGLFAWFDFSPESLEWHKRVAQELWEMYGRHESFYGFYVSEESSGDLANGAPDAAGETLRRQQIVQFFAGLKAWCLQLAPGKPLMLSTNSMEVPAGAGTYPELLKHLDILCPFGFARMPPSDLPGPEAARLLQDFCDTAGAHLWFDLEAFLFNDDQSLYPRDLESIAADLRLFDRFEKVLCYQYPGVFSDPEGIRVGEEKTVVLYRRYRKYLEELRQAQQPPVQQQPAKQPE